MNNYYFLQSQIKIDIFISKIYYKCVCFKFTKLIARTNIPRWEFYSKVFKKICVVNFIIFLGTIKIGIIIGNYI